MRFTFLPGFLHRQGALEKAFYTGLQGWIKCNFTALGITHSSSTLQENYGPLSTMVSGNGRLSRILSILVHWESINRSVYFQPRTFHNASTISAGDPVIVWGSWPRRVGLFVRLTPRPNNLIIRGRLFPTIMVPR